MEALRHTMEEILSSEKYKKSLEIHLRCMSSWNGRRLEMKGAWAARSKFHRKMFYVDPPCWIS